MRGRLIVNADDWGRDPRTTDMTAACIAAGAVSSVSAMVFMEDSERAALLAREHGIDAGLHLNFTTPFSSPAAATRLRERQRATAAFLRSHRLAQIVFRPDLVRAFADIVAAQIDEYRRLYQREPARFDGHHHMHLCANVLLQRLLPSDTAVRRSFSFERGEKSCANRLYRRVVDGFLIRHHVVTDFFFSIAPWHPPDRLARVVRLSEQSVVELETHPADCGEYQFLMDGGLARTLGAEEISTRWDTQKPFRSAPTASGGIRPR